MTKDLVLRAETPADRASVATVLARTYLQDGAAAIALVSRLRELPEHQPKLSLVGLLQNKVSAYACFTPVKVGKKPSAALLLSPIAIDTQNPDLTPHDWVEAVVTEVARLGHRYVLVRGQVALYQPQGFMPATSLGVHDHPAEGEDPLMVKDLNPNAPLTLQGAVVYPLD